MFIDNYTLMASAVWGAIGQPHAITFDTLGDINHQLALLDNDWMAHTEVTFDDKLLYLTSINDVNDNFDVYLFKLNQQLIDDTIYTQMFNYDSICPFHIIYDTIVQDKCRLIVGLEESHYFDNERYIDELLIYPNPASKSLSIKGEANTSVVSLV